MKKIYFMLLFLFLLQNKTYSNNLPIVSCLVAFMVDFEDDGEGPPLEDPPAPAPIDDWLPLLGLAGVAYAYVKLGPKSS